MKDKTLPSTNPVEELYQLAKQAHWRPVGALAFVSEMGYARTPDTMTFPHTPKGLHDALAWARQQAAITWSKPGEQEGEQP